MNIFSVYTVYYTHSFFRVFSPSTIHQFPITVFSLLSNFLLSILLYILHPFFLRFSCCLTIVPSLEGTVHPNQRTVLGTVPRSLIVLRLLPNRFSIVGQLFSYGGCCSFCTLDTVFRLFGILILGFFMMFSCYLFINSLFSIPFHFIYSLFTSSLFSVPLFIF
ncbi:MAG: hypothetical protein PWQ77_691 [Kosmotogales bacterium]|nr:hypothetical protein [Kosmotogales bacterium]